MSAPDAIPDRARHPRAWWRDRALETLAYVAAAVALGGVLWIKLHHGG